MTIEEADAGLSFGVVSVPCASDVAAAKDQGIVDQESQVPRRRADVWRLRSRRFGVTNREL